MSTSETAPLNPSGADPAAGMEASPSAYDDESVVMNTIKKRRDPTHVFILYGLSIIVSIGGLGAAFWGYCIVRTAPFDKEHKQEQRESYESSFLGMQSIIVFVRPP